jgi:hypothetical protein
VGLRDWIAEGAEDREGGGVNKPNLDEFILNPEHLKTLKPGTGVVGQSRPRQKTVSGIRHKDAFAIIPLWWAERAAKAGRNINLMVCVDLVYRAWRARGKAGEKRFALPNSRGVHRATKIRTLRALERAGLIRVEWRERKSPMVTLIVSIF